MPQSDLSLVLAQTHAALEWARDGELRAEAIYKGGSDRHYFRVRGALRPIIACRYGVEREENEGFVRLTEYLHKRQVSVPEIYCHDAENRWIWMEDLGETDLWEFRKAEWEIRKQLYFATIDESCRMHSIAEVEENVRLQPPFSEATYQWEQGYFFDHFAANFSALSPEGTGAIREGEGLRQLRGHLDQLPRRLVHRDFQSQNVMIQREKPAFIDYQGMRLGLPEYDLASLILDPYVEFTADEREVLISHAESRGANRTLFYQCAVQRLMQALGAYGFLALVRGKTSFLDHIAPAVRNLHLVLDQLPELEDLRQVLEMRPSGA